MNYIKRNVLMVPSKNETDIQTLMNGKLHIENGLSVPLLSYEVIHILSDDIPKKGDYVIGGNNQFFGQVLGISALGDTIVLSKPCNEPTGMPIEWFKKIIATTDKELDLPRPSKQFIKEYFEEYNKGNNITEVKVEYENGKTCVVCGAYQIKEYLSCHYPKGGNTCCGGSLYHKLKVNSDNTINIKSTKTSWNREEVIEFAYKILTATGKGIKAEMVDIIKNPHIEFTGVDKWIEENL